MKNLLNYDISNFQKEKSGHFLKVFGIKSVDEKKISFPESEFINLYGSELVRQYSQTGVLMTHLMSLVGFASWFNDKSQFSVYGACSEGSFSFQEGVALTILELHKQFGPRQYLQSFPAFSIYAFMNRFHLSGPATTYISTKNRIYQAVEQALFDIQFKYADQVIIAASNKTAQKDPVIQEGVFFINTNSEEDLKNILQKLDMGVSEELVYSCPIPFLELDTLK